MGSLDPGIDAAASNLYLETLIEREWTETLTLDGCGNAIRSTWRPKKNIIRLNKLTFEYRMQGESWREVEDHR